MNADQIAEIRPAIREAIKGAPKTCVTLEVDGEPDKWMQIVDRTVNAAYPHSDDPNERVKGMGSVQLMTKVTSWEPGKFATFIFAELEATVVSHWVDAYFVKVLSCASGEYHVNVACEQL